MANCENCGYKNGDTAERCNNCGFDLKKDGFLPPPSEDSLPDFAPSSQIEYETQFQDFEAVIKRKYFSFRRTYLVENSLTQKKLYLIKGTLHLRWPVFGFIFFLFFGFSFLSSVSFLVQDLNNIYSVLSSLLVLIFLIWAIVALFHKILYFNSFQVENFEGIRVGTIRGNWFRTTWKIVDTSNNLISNIKFRLYRKSGEIEIFGKNFEFVHPSACFSHNLECKIIGKGFSNPSMIIKAQYFSKYSIKIRLSDLATGFNSFAGPSIAICCIEKFFISRGSGGGGGGG